MTENLEKLVNAALPHVVFDGWSPDSFDAAVRDSGLAPDVAQALCPRGALDLAVAWHHMGDAAMAAALKDHDLQTMRIRDRITLAVRLRLEGVTDKEAVRRASALFALPIHAAEGAGLIWGTADAIWTGLGDPSRDVNWYSKRATLAGVYGAVVLFWLGDDSPDHQATWAFLDRRIDNVMQIEKVKAQARDNPVVSRLMAGPLSLLSRIKAPEQKPNSDFPGRWTPPPVD